jgi:hypothetical protein
MIDPLTALAGLQSAISLVKKAANVANDLGSLAPMLGKMFDAKSTATKALIETKKSNKGSNLGTALQIEMALEQARAFEEELKMLFMQTGKIDVWNKIKSRQHEMDRDDAIAMRKLKDEEKRKKEKDAELAEIAVVLGLVAFTGFLLFIGIYEAWEFCKINRCGH